MAMTSCTLFSIQIKKVGCGNKAAATKAGNGAGSSSTTTASTILNIPPTKNHAVLSHWRTYRYVSVPIGKNSFVLNYTLVVALTLSKPVRLIQKVRSSRENILYIGCRLVVTRKGKNGCKDCVKVSVITPSMICWLTEKEKHSCMRKIKLTIWCIFFYYNNLFTLNDFSTFIPVSFICAISSRENY